MNIRLDDALKEPLPVRVARGGMQLAAESSPPRFVEAAGTGLSVMSVTEADGHKILCLPGICA